MDYIASLERAILYIENHLGDDLRAEDAAREAGYSYYHFTRLFSAVLGETVGSYIKKRRLAEAAGKLIDTDSQILKIAMSVGFTTAESFSRAFKSAYNVTPAAYRKNRLDLFISGKPQLDLSRIHCLSERVTLQPAIVTLPDIMTAGLRGQTTLKDNVIPALWSRFLTEIHRIPHRLPGNRCFGICEACQEGNTLYTMNRDVLFSEIAAAQVDSFKDLPKPFVPKILKGGRYAVFTYTGELSGLMDLYSYIWGTWFLDTKETLDARDDFELYDDRFLGMDNPDSQIEIYIPIL